MQDDRPPSQMVPFHVTQIIAAALIIGPLLFAVIAYVVVNKRPPGNPILAYLAVGASAMALAVSITIPAIVTGPLLEKARGLQGAEWVQGLFAVYQTRMIIRSAVLEGAAFFCGVAYMGSAQLWVLGLMVGLLVVMAVGFPTRGRFDDWARAQRELSSL